MKSKNKMLFNLASLILVGSIFGVQFTTVISCSTTKNNNSKFNIVLKEKNIINKIKENSKLSIKEENEYKEKQKKEYSNLSIKSINDFLLKNMNMNLNDYFINLNLHNNWNNNDINYIDPSLGVLLVEDILDGDILIKDISNIFNEYKENNYEEYTKILNDMNLTEKEINESKNIEEIVAIDPEDEEIEKEFDDIQNENYDEEVVYDEMMKLNDKYKEDEIIYINFKESGNFYTYKDFEALESRYVEEYDLYFDTPLVVTIEMNDEVKIDIENFDIFELERIYKKSGFLDCVSETMIYYKGERIYWYRKEWWKNAYKNISKMYYKFKPIKNKINEGNNIVSSEKNDYKIKMDQNTYDFIYDLEKKLVSMKTYYDRTEDLNIASWTLTAIAWSVAAIWTTTSIFSFGATAGHAAAAVIQATSLTITNSITSAELTKTKMKLDKYWSLYNSKEYDLLMTLLNIYGVGQKIPINDFIEINIKVYWNYFQIKDYIGRVVEFTNASINKLANKWLNKPTSMIFIFQEIDDALKMFKNSIFRGTKKIIEKVSKKFYQKLSIILVKETAQKVTLIATSWANPISLIIEGFDFVFTIIGICNDVFSLYEN